MTLHFQMSKPTPNLEPSNATICLFRRIDNFFGSVISLCISVQERRQFITISFLREDRKCLWKISSIGLRYRIRLRLSILNRFYRFDPPTRHVRNDLKNSSNPKGSFSFKLSLLSVVVSIPISSDFLFRD